MADGEQDGPARAGFWTIERALLVLCTSASVLAFSFGIGVQWAKTTAVEARLFAAESSLKQEYVRNDVYAADQRRLTEAIERLVVVVDKLADKTSPPTAVGASPYPFRPGAR